MLKVRELLQLGNNYVLWKLTNDASLGEISNNHIQDEMFFIVLEGLELLTFQCFLFILNKY